MRPPERTEAELARMTFLQRYDYWISMAEYHEARVRFWGRVSVGGLVLSFAATVVATVMS